MRSDLRRIYKDRGIRIDFWRHKLRDVRGAYFNDDLGRTVMLAAGLPDDPTIFTMAHELKHDLVDRDRPVACCTEPKNDDYIEIGAEIFAAELIFPEADFIDRLTAAGVDRAACTAEHIVHLKHDSKTTLSYAGLAKRATFLGFALPGKLDGVKWKKLEEEIYGEPLYKKLLRRRSHGRGV
jgi:hypothetical protein